MAKNIQDQFFQDALKTLEKSFGKAFNERGIAEGCYDAIPSGYDDLDDVATRGAKGVYRGGVIELFGPEAGGKTSIAMSISSQAQKMGLNVCWIDAESGFSPDLAEINGVDLSKLVLPDLAELKRKNSESPIPTAGEILDLIYKVVMSGGFGLVVLDSVAGLNPARVLDKDYDPNKMGMAEIARAMSEHLSKISPACAKQECTVIMVNQIRMKPGDMWNPEDTPGGRALKFFAHQRFRVDRVGGAKGDVIIREFSPVTGKEEERVIGHYARLRIPKNKRGAPFRDPIMVPIYYEFYDPDDAKKCFDCARKLQVITVRKGTYAWKDGDEVVSREEGEQEMLEYIRGGHEPRLAACCVTAAEDEKNIKKTEPVKIPASVAAIVLKQADELTDAVEKKSNPKKTKSGKRASVDL